MDLVEFEDAYSKVTLVSTIRAFSLVARALAAMLETLVRIQYIALLHASCLLECGEGGKHTCLIHMHSTVRICPLQPFTAQTAKLIFISTVSGTYDKCRVFWEISTVISASRLHRGGQWFESTISHQILPAKLFLYLCGLNYLLAGVF